MSSSHPRGYKPALDLTGSDFEALGSTRRQRQRAGLRERMSAWGRRVSPRISSLGIESEVELSEEERAESLRFVSREGVLVLRVEDRGVEVGLELPPVVLDSKVSESRLLASLESLPEPFVVRNDEEETIAQAAGLDMFERGAWIGWHITKNVAIEHAELLDDQLEDALAALAGVLAVTAPDKAVTMPRRAPRLQTSASRRTRTLIEKGAQVQVLHGPFAGKVGIVVDLDGKGGARVALGLLEARMQTSDLALAEGGRPKLGTSHRRFVAR